MADEEQSRRHRHHHHPSIECSVQPLDLSFHPQREHLVAAAVVDGTVECHEYTYETNTDDTDDDDDDEHDTIISSIPITVSTNNNNSKKTSCRAVLFSKDTSQQQHLYAGTSDGQLCILDVERACTLSSTTTSSACVQSRFCHGRRNGNGIHSLYQLPPDDQQLQQYGLVVSGHDDGCICLWDVRQQRTTAETKQQPVVMWNHHDDYISDFCFHDYTLLATSADGCLSAMDVRMALSKQQHSDRRSLHQLQQNDDNTNIRISDNQEDELLSVQVLKNGRKVVCGTQQGVLAVWSWGTWGDVSDRFPGHPASIDALLKVDEDTLVTGSSDGLLRLVQIHPDKLLGVLGNHDGYPIEKIQFNSTRSFVGSVSHDNMIRLWDARVLQEEDTDDENSNDDDSEDEAMTTCTEQKVKPAVLTSMPASGSDDEWHSADDTNATAVHGRKCDSDESSSSSGSDDDDDDGKHGRNPKRLKTANEKFFEDL